MLIKNIDEQTIALAGLYQSCYVVSNIAWKGEYNEQDFLPLINSILQIDSTIVKDIYIDIDNIKSGFIYLKKQIIGDIFTRSSETRRYIESLKILSNHLIGDQETVTLMQSLLKELKENTDDLTIDEKAEKLSGIYQKTLSKFEPRIIVNDISIMPIDINEGSVEININYTVITTNVRDNIVFPYYLNEGTNIKKD